MPSPVFFLSYAHADYDANPKALDKLYDELCRCVAPRTGRSLDNVGFQDSHTLRLGANWQEQVIEALQTCSVFVPVYSLNYFASDICGREWGLFHERVASFSKARPLAPAPSQVAPLLWLGKSDLDGKIPQRVSDIQYKNESYGVPYVDLGFENLHRRRRQSAEQTVISELCADIVRLHKANPAIPKQDNAPETIQELPSMWSAPGGRAAKLGPRWVQFVFVAATQEEIATAAPGRGAYYGAAGEQWRPFLPVLEKEAILLATQVVNDEGLFFQSIDIDHNVKQRVAEAGRRRNLVALVVDTWSLSLPQYSAIAQLGDDDSTHLNCVVVLPFGADEEPPDRRKYLEGLLSQTFPGRMKRNDELISIDAVRSPDAFRVRLAKALARARAAIDRDDGHPIARPVPAGGPPPTISASQPAARTG